MHRTSESSKILENKDCVSGGESVRERVRECGSEGEAARPRFVCTARNAPCATGYAPCTRGYAPPGDFPVAVHLSEPVLLKRPSLETYRPARRLRSQARAHTRVSGDFGSRGAQWQARLRACPAPAVGAPPRKEACVKHLFSGGGCEGRRGGGSLRGVTASRGGRLPLAY